MQNDRYKKILIEERNYALKNLGLRAETISQQGRVAEEDQAPVSHEQFISLKVNSISHSKLRLLNQALERLRNGDYGICETCEQAIPARRLQAVPWAKYCVPCQERATASEFDQSSDAEFEADAA